MLYLTQLIYIKEGQESVFDEFEAVAIPIIARYSGQLLLRTRPGQVIETAIEAPYEIHIVSFPSQQDFERFMKDEERKSFLHLKEQSIRESLIISGYRL